MSHPFTPVDVPEKRGVAELSEDLVESLARVGEAVGFEGSAGIDELTDHLAALTEPTTLVLVGWQRMAFAEPGAWAALRAVLERAADADENFVVLHGPISRDGNAAL